VIEDAPGGLHRVVMERRYGGNGPYGLATAIYTVGLFVASHTLGWPDRSRIQAVFDRYPPT
jgi:hypothetical protein